MILSAVTPTSAKADRGMTMTVPTAATPARNSRLWIIGDFPILKFLPVSVIAERCRARCLHAADKSTPCCNYLFHRTARRSFRGHIGGPGSRGLGTTAAGCVMGVLVAKAASWIGR